jgi:hypothetical protein
MPFMAQRWAELIRMRLRRTTAVEATAPLVYYLGMWVLPYVGETPPTHSRDYS